VASATIRGAAAKFGVNPNTVSAANLLRPHGEAFAADLAALGGFAGQPLLLELDGLE
jgi:hypothetical protein